MATTLVVVIVLGGSAYVVHARRSPAVSVLSETVTVPTTVPPPAPTSTGGLVLPSTEGTGIGPTSPPAEPSPTSAVTTTTTPQQALVLNSPLCRVNRCVPLQHHR